MWGDFNTRVGNKPVISHIDLGLETPHLFKKSRYSYNTVRLYITINPFLLFVLVY